MITLVLITFVDLFVPAFSGVLLLRVVLSYLMRPGSRLMDVLIGLTEPLLVPVRKIVPVTSGVDFAPVIALLLLQGVQYIVHALYLR
jgi:YggT family protein